ncbi:kunitz-type protease inhibitor 2 [Chelmon rostratus]|uniref:kunitz-type protease inhibitor 2 n=1 Tax=Chelmon rostratus TaxID=109905 RepID=UPI001BE7D1AD|nr:kunitz-type protease inhibitor 2 [Chelmon rostratus]
MRQKHFASSLLALCFLVCSGLGLNCDWEHSPGTDQSLHTASVNAGDFHMDDIPGVSDPESCRAACCDKPDCDMVLVGHPADGPPQCQLVKCLTQSRDACVFQPSTQLEVYRKKVKTETRGEAKEGGEKHIVPLLGSVEPKTNETNNIRCRLPMKVGSCRAAFPKFYYNVTSQSCQSFIYGGCEANKNNFDTLDECKTACSGVTGSVLPDESTPAPQLPVKAVRMVPAFNTKDAQDAEGPVESETAAAESVHAQETEMSADDFAERCGAEPQVGPCRAALQHWYYNRKTSSCESFIYGGCKGNKNNYISKESCIATCTVTVLPSSKKVTDDEAPTEYKDQCMVTPDPGPCRAAFPMFYYDPNAGTCQSFIYGGCRGNQNRYSSVEDCMRRCTTDGCFDGHGRARNRWTAAVFLFITLAAISALLLATLIIITMRRRGLSRRPSSISDKEELLPDPDEQSSVESLNVPESPKLDKA